MRSNGFHVVLRRSDDGVLAPSVAQRRRAAQRFAAMSIGFPVVAWCVADTHAHVVTLGDAESTAELVRRLRIGWGRAAGANGLLEVQRRKPLADAAHAWAAFRYALAQGAHHGVVTDPYHEASALADLLGLRVPYPEIVGRVREHFPRLQRAALLTILGVPALDEQVHLEHLAEAACAAFAVEAMTRRASGAEIRRAAVAAASGCPRADIADALGITPGAVRKLAGEPTSPRAIRAVRLQMALRAARPPELNILREPALRYAVGAAECPAVA